MNVHELFMDFIDQKCRESGITREELSRRLGWHKSAVSRYHNKEMPYGISLSNAYSMITASEASFLEFFAYLDEKLKGWL
jgi:transcriptional regulator with XRE-family HTH domain